MNDPARRSRDGGIVFPGLVLSRGAGESVVIQVPAGEAVTVRVKVTEIYMARPGKRATRLHFNAPRSVQIDRAEIHAAKERDGQRMRRQQMIGYAPDSELDPVG